MDGFDQDRMVAEQIEKRGVSDPGVLTAMREVPRRAFVPDHLSRGALGDHALPIGFGQTISQPFIVAKTAELLMLRSEHSVLEVGGGCGSQAAVLSKLVTKVVSLEIVQALADQARRHLEQLGVENVEVHCVDGYNGWPASAPYDRICLAASPLAIPDALVRQLKLGGRLVGPVGDKDQHLHIVDRHEAGCREQKSIGVRFVPMTGRATLKSE